MAKAKKKSKPTQKNTSGQSGAVQAEVIPNRKLYVGGLALDVTEAQIRKTFESCGEITSVDLIVTTKHAFGFVEFTTIAIAESAIEQLNGESDMVVKFARSQTATDCAVSVPTPKKQTLTEHEDTENSDHEGEAETTEEAQKEEPKKSLSSAGYLDAHAARAAASREYSNPIESLQDLMQKATRATIISELISYTFDGASGAVVATVKLVAPDGNIVHTCKPQESKRDAKKAAALAALRDPEVHRLLPPLPPKNKELKAAKERHCQNDESDLSELEEESEKAHAVLSTREKEQLEAAEKKVKKRSAREKAKAAMEASEALLEEEPSDESDDSGDYRSEEIEEDESSSGEDEESEGFSDSDEEAVKNAAIKARPAKNASKKTNKEDYDVCIIGAGPAGLAALSACVEPLSLDLLGGIQGSRAVNAFRLQKKNAEGGSLIPRVCVVDTETWLTTWRQRFRNVNIDFLRSPTIAHPDAFDPFAMLAFAGENSRTQELVDSGCVDKKLSELPEAHDGSWHLPSNKLFLDFCDNLVSRSPHEFVKGRANSIEGEDGEFKVSLDDGRELRSAAIVVAIGVPGPPVIPACIANLPSHLMFHSDFESGARLKEVGENGAKRILVLGGGLTAVQVALLGVKRKCQVTLCSRRPLTSRHFDIDKGWFDYRESARHRFGFFSLPVEERLSMIKQTRGGGSVPPLYMDQLRLAESSDLLKVIVSEVEVSEVLDNAVDVKIDGSIERYDLVVSACGHRPDCTQLPVIQSLLEHSPTQITGGLPHLSQDLQWGKHKQLFVIGSLASLQVGPDAGNLMGIRRAAQILPSPLGLRDWLEDLQTDGTSLRRNIRRNMYALLQHDDEESEAGSEEERLKEESEQIKAERKELMLQQWGTASKRRLGKRRGQKKAGSGRRRGRGGR